MLARSRCDMLSRCRSSPTSRSTSSASRRVAWVRRARASGKIGLASLDFSRGTLILTEASTQKRATLHLVRGEAALAEHDPGGLEVLASTFEAFRARMLAEN